MTALSLSREEFAAQRRTEQDDLIERLQGVIGATFSTGDVAPLKAALANIYREVFLSSTDSDREPDLADVNRFLEKVDGMLEHANEDSSVHTTALSLANAVLNAATNDAYKHMRVELEWVSMRDTDVRHTHEVADGQRRLPGETFTVGESQMLMPGDLSAPIEEWVNCRCVLKPVESAEVTRAKALGGDIFREAVKEFGLEKALELIQPALTAAADKEQGEWFAVMAVPVEDDPVHAIGNEEKHATVVYFGELEPGETTEAIGQWVAQIAADAQPFTAAVKEVGELGHDDEKVPVWLLEESDLNGIFDGVMSDETVKAAYDAADTTKYPNYTPHVTISDGEVPAEASEVAEIKFDRLSLWHGGQHTDYPLGADMTEAAVKEEIPTDEEIETPPGEEAPVVDDRIPWYGVLAPEGVRSGDGRQFSNLGRTRELPLPLTWQEVSADGHDQNITVAQIEWVEMRGNLMWGGGHFLSSVEEADEAIGLIAEFGRFGVSVDADDIGSATYDEDSETETYDDPRISSACIVSIPAFAEAFVAIGEDPGVIEPAEGVDLDEQIEDAEDEEALAAAGQPLLHLAGVPESFKQAALAKAEAERLAAEDWSDLLTAAKTEDGPGWLTHPVDTDRLRDYWVRGPGAAKIGWGTPGDFNRCRVNVAEYVKPQHLNGYCANRHYDALGIWPGPKAHSSEGIAAQIAEKIAAGDDRKVLATNPAPTLTLVASGGKAPGYFAPSDFFSEPDVDPDDGVVIDPPNEDGLMRAYGYIAEWGVCHIGYDGMCKEAPFSKSNYAFFKTGSVNTPDGPVRVGALTAATGHANPRLKPMPAAAHYDDTGSVWAMVTTGENDRGIWFSGLVKPGADEQLLNDVVASGRLSGDWRPFGTDLELVAALTVNVPGFPIMPTTTAAHDGRQLSLVAAGVPAPKVEESPTVTLDLNNTEGLSLIASLVVDEMEARKNRRDRLDALKEKVDH